MPGIKQKQRDSDDKGFMTVRDAMEFTSLSENSIYRAIEQKKLMKYKFGRRTLLSRLEVEQLVRPSQ